MPPVRPEAGEEDGGRMLSVGQENSSVGRVPDLDRCVGAVNTTPRDHPRSVGAKVDAAHPAAKFVEG